MVINHLLNGMILQVVMYKLYKYAPAPSSQGTGIRPKSMVSIGTLDPGAIRCTR